MDSESKNHSDGLVPEDDAEPTFCNMCRELPEEYIALSCAHNFCLLCLTKLSFQNTDSRLVKSIEDDKNPEDYQILCPIDNKPTPLNSSSIEALNKVRENFGELEQKKRPVYNEVIFEESAENFHTTDEFPKKKTQKALNAENKVMKSSFSSEEKDNKPRYLDKNFQSAKEFIENNGSLLNPTPVKQAIEKNTSKKLEMSTSYCPIHENEEPIIVCFTCGNKPLCVECVVNGEHKSHEMVNISRIRDSCREALVNLGPEIERKQREFAEVIEKLGRSKKMFSDKIWEIKSRISQDINELKERLSLKENELLIAKDCEASEKFAEIDGLISGFEEKIGRLAEFQRNLDLKAENSQYFNSQGIELLNYFTTKKDEIMAILSSEFGNISENFDDFKVEIDKEHYIRYLEGLHNLHLTTSNLNDFDEKLRSSQQFFQTSLSKFNNNIEKSITINDQQQQQPKGIFQGSPIIEENRAKLFSKKKEAKDSVRLVESPLKSGHLTNSSFNNTSFFNEKTRIKYINYRSLGRINENRGLKYDFQEKLGSRSTFGKGNVGKYFSAAKAKPKETDRLNGISRALENQNQLFQKRKEVFYA